MSFYEQQPPWGPPPPARQQSWELQAPPSRSGANSTSNNEPGAFASQVEEIDRAVDNLMKSGKYYPGVAGGLQGFGVMPARRDSLPLLSRPYPEYDSRPGGTSRHHSISEYDGARSGSSAGLQSFYAGQRFPPRPTEQDQAAQAKRRVAAQRERELRNYHQEQQYNKNSQAVKSDGAMSPNAMNNEEERRELIARQHRALYSNDSGPFPADGSAHPLPQDARLSMPVHARGPSPMAFDPFNAQQSQSGAEGAAQVLPRDQNAASTDRRTSSSPTSASRSNFGIDSGPHSAVSPTTSPSLAQGNMPSIATQSGVAPIGTRPTHQTGAKRAATPNERTGSAASNPTPVDKTSSLGWGTGSGVWGASKNPLGVQASVWG